MSAPDTGALQRSLARAAEDCWQALCTTWPGFSVEVLPSIDSTNSELMRRARAGDRSQQLLIAIEQSAGRGRRGKSWVGQPGAALTFSLGLPYEPADWSGLSLAIGVSLADALHPGLRLKWPNDLWWQGRKLGGILVETAISGPRRHLVVGIGLNVELPPELPPAPDGPAPLPPAALRELDAARDAGDWLLAVVPALARDLLLFEREGFVAFAERFAARDALQGVDLMLSDGRQGRGAGVAPDGALRLQTAAGLVEVSSAEVSVRPR